MNYNLPRYVYIYIDELPYVYIYIWLVVSNIFYLSIIYGTSLAIDYCFSEGLKPPTRYIYIYTYIKQVVVILKWDIMGLT